MLNTILILLIKFYKSKNINKNKKNYNKINNIKHNYKNSF